MLPHGNYPCSLSQIDPICPAQQSDWVLWTFHRSWYSSIALSWLICWCHSFSQMVYSGHSSTSQSTWMVTHLLSEFALCRSTICSRRSTLRSDWSWIDTCLDLETQTMVLVWIEHPTYLLKSVWSFWREMWFPWFLPAQEEGLLCLSSILYHWGLGWLCLRIT